MASRMLLALIACALVAGCSASLEVDLGGAGMSLSGSVPTPAPAPGPAQTGTSYAGRKLAGFENVIGGRKLSELVDASNQLVDTSSLGLPSNPVTGLVNGLPVDASVDTSKLPVFDSLPQLADVNGAGLGLSGAVPVPAPAPAPATARRPVTGRL